jgi:hypothetical protein
MGLAEQIAQHLDVQLVASALEQGALFLCIEGRGYAAVPEEWGWWVWELKRGGPEYAVGKDFSYCTCPAPQPCKHVVALKHGGVRTPFKPPHRRKRGKRPGPRG